MHAESLPRRVNSQPSRVFMHPYRSLAVVALCFFGIATAASAQVMEAPVTMAMTISYTGPETSKTSSGGTDYKATLSTFKFTNKDYLAALKQDGVITSTDGWKLVARWTAGALPESYGFWLTHPSLAAIQLNSEGAPIIDLTALAAGYSERVQNGETVSGSGKIKFYTAFSFSSTDDEFQLRGIGSGSYVIKAPAKGSAPSLIFSSLKMELQGGLVAGEDEGVLEMTLSVGSPQIVKGTESTPPFGGGLGTPPPSPPDSGGGTTVSPSS